MKLLIIDTEKTYLEVVQQEFESNGINADMSFDIEEGLHRALHEDYDCIILEILFPGADGFQCIENLRNQMNDTPVIITTSKATIEDRVQGLERGADDYIVKPYDFRELLARVKAVSRRYFGRKRPLMKCGDLALEPVARECHVAEDLIPLRRREFDILELLMKHENQVFSRERIISHVWQKEYDGTSNVVDVHIKYLRDKLRVHNYDRIIVTVRGVGYKVACPDWH